MSLQQHQKDWKMFFHVPLIQENQTLSNKVMPLCSSSDTSDMIQQDGSSKLIDQIPNTQGQQLNRSSPLPTMQRAFSPPRFLSHSHGNSIMETSHSRETYSPHSSSSTSSSLPNLVGYWQTVTMQTDSRPESHVSQQHPCLVLQQPQPEPLNNNCLEQSYYLTQATAQLSPICSYISQSDVNSTFGTDKQNLLNDKFTTLPPLTPPPLYQIHDYNSSINYQPYLQLPPLHGNYLSLGDIPSNLSGDYSNSFLNNSSASSNSISGNENGISHYTQVLLQRCYHPRAKQPGSTDYLSSVQPIKVSNSFLSRPFKCDQCFQSFNRNHDLKRHKRIHLAVKPFPCPNCEKSFSRKDALKRHILVKGCIR